MFASKYFNVGQVFVTHGINTAMMENKRFAVEVGLCLRRYCVKDFGIISEEDKQTNKESLNHPDDLYLLAAYQTCNGKIWIITNSGEEIGENITSVLFQNER